MTNDEARSEATFHFRVDNFRDLKDSVLSPPCYVRNLPWKILVMPRQKPSPNGQQQKSLGFFLQCDGQSESSGWSCYAMAELRLLSHKFKTDTLYRKIQHLFCSKENDFGFSTFMEWSDVVDSAKGYMKDGAITLEVHVTAEPPHGVSWDSKKHTAAPTMDIAPKTDVASSANISTCLLKLYEDTDFTDFELRGEDGSVHVHRAVLAASSPVLRQMLSGTWRETKEGHVDVPGTSQLALQHLKGYLYLHQLPDSGLEQLLLLSSYYIMPDLEQKCVDKLVNTLTAENACDLLEFAAKHKMKSLMVAVLESIQSGAIKVSDIKESLLRGTSVEKTLTAQNACDLLEFAFKHKMKNLIVATLESAQSGAIKVSDIKEQLFRGTSVE